MREPNDLGVTEEGAGSVRSPRESPVRLLVSMSCPCMDLGPQRCSIVDRGPWATGGEFVRHKVTVCGSRVVPRFLALA